MTTIRSIINSSFREAGITPIGSTPEADEFAEALDRIQVIIRSLFGTELGESLESVNYGSAGLTNSFALNEDVSPDISSSYFPSNTRLILNIDSAVTLHLSPNPQDGARIGIIDNGGNLATYNVTLSGNGRKIETASTAVLNTNSLNREWFYRADTGNWVRITDLTANDESPLPLEFDDFLITLLAFRLNPRYGAETSQEMMEVLRRMKKMFQARYKQEDEKTIDEGIWRLCSNWWSVYSRHSENAFKRGK